MAPPRHAQHDTAAEHEQNQPQARLFNTQISRRSKNEMNSAAGFFSGPSPTMRRISPRACAAARNSRKPVACVDFDSLLAVGIENELVMMIDRLRQAEQRLQQPMNAGRPEQILPAHDVGDALQGVVENGTER
jgi:hypothetical protein